MAQARSGGGINSSVVKQVGIQGGSRTTQPVSPRGVSQFGYSPGSTLDKSGSFTTKSSALPVFEAKKPNPVPFGNTEAAAAVAGPGGSRTIYHSGTQAVHGPVVAGSTPAGQPRDILSGFGPEPTDRSPLVERRR
jgi:hypothetical protein